MLQLPKHLPGPQAGDAIQHDAIFEERCYLHMFHCMRPNAWPIARSGLEVFCGASPNSRRAAHAYNWYHADVKVFGASAWRPATVLTGFDALWSWDLPRIQLT